MKKLSVILLLIQVFAFSQANKDELYIRRFAKIAIEQMKEYKIPASIKLGQGLLETAHGQSELAQNANNHFGIKCKVSWTGETYRYTDDAYMECFRKYDNADDSYRDHSLFLTTRSHYSPLFKLDIKDYKGWAYGLKKAGYATNPKYPQILIGRIEKYKLYEFDKIDTESQLMAKLDELYPDSKTKIADVEVYDADIIDIPEVEKEVVKIEINEPEEVKNPNYRIREHQNKKLKYVVVKKHETLKHLSNWFNVSIPDLKNFNDLEDINKINEGQNIFLENKRTKGKERYYQVRKGETMYSISQKNGIKLEKLYCRNRMKEGEEPQIGEILNLKGKRKKKKK